MVITSIFFSFCALNLWLFAEASLHAECQPHCHWMLAHGTHIPDSAFHQTQVTEADKVSAPSGIFFFFLKAPSLIFVTTYLTFNLDLCQGGEGHAFPAWETVQQTSQGIVWIVTGTWDQVQTFLLRWVDHFIHPPRLPPQRIVNIYSAFPATKVIELMVYYVSSCCRHNTRWKPGLDVLQDQKCNWQRAEKDCVDSVCVTMTDRHVIHLQVTPPSQWSTTVYAGLYWYCSA